MIPSYAQIEEELKLYRDETGYLSPQKTREYLAKKGVAKIVDNDFIVLVDNATGAIPYKEFMNRIEILESKKKYKKVGTMGVNKETNKTNDITADEIDF